MKIYYSSSFFILITDLMSIIALWKVNAFFIGKELYESICKLNQIHNDFAPMKVLYQMS